MNLDIFHTDDIRVEYCDDSRRDIQRVLDACREERRPYVIIKNECSAQQSCCSEVQKRLSRILVPVSMLEEEVYKAETAYHRLQRVRWVEKRWHLIARHIVSCHCTHFLYSF